MISNFSTLEAYFSVEEREWDSCSSRWKNKGRQARSEWDFTAICIEKHACGCQKTRLTIWAAVAAWRLWFLVKLLTPSKVTRSLKDACEIQLSSSPPFRGIPFPFWIMESFQMSIGHSDIHVAYSASLICSKCLLLESGLFPHVSDDFTRTNNLGLHQWHTGTTHLQVAEQITNNK